MSWWQAALLGLVQGLAEFLPISSSGHLVLGEHLLGLDTSGDVTFEVFVHFGTALSILTVYRRRIGRILADALGALSRPALWRAAVAAGPIESARDGASGAAGGEAAATPSLRVVLYVLLTMLPTGLAYVLFKDPLEAAFENPRLVCWMLLVTGTLLLLTRLRPDPDGALSPAKALAVGVAQSLALIPGISRSGATICAAIYQNVDRKQAADFSFLMLVPVVLGATLLKALEMGDAETTVGWLPLVVGTLVAYVSGVFAVRAVVVLVQRHALQYFAYYCYAVGVLGLLFIR